jgi:hypothetical protein
MDQDSKEHQHSHEQSGKNNSTHNAAEKKGEQDQNQPGQPTPKKDVQGGEKQQEHQKTGTR